MLKMITDGCFSVGIFGPDGCEKSDGLRAGCSELRALTGFSSVTPNTPDLMERKGIETLIEKRTKGSSSAEPDLTMETPEKKPHVQINKYFDDGDGDENGHADGDDDNPDDNACTNSSDDHDDDENDDSDGETPNKLIPLSKRTYLTSSRSLRPCKAKNGIESKCRKSQTFASRRRCVSQAELEAAARAADHFKSNWPHTSKVMKKSHVYRGFWASHITSQ